MRRVAGVLAMLLALVVVVAAAATAIVVGPDNRVVTGPHDIDTEAVAVVTKPSALSWSGPTVSVLVEVPDEKPVFVGLGSSVDVEDYLQQTARVQVDDISVPWKIATSSVQGRKNLPASPAALDWWIADAAGLGGASTSFTLPDQTVSLAILPVGDSDLEGLQVTAAYDVRGGFGSGIGLVALGLGLTVLGWLLVRQRHLLQPENVEEVVYVYIDDDGVEHEIDPATAHEYEIVEDVELTDPGQPASRWHVPGRRGR